MSDDRRRSREQQDLQPAAAAVDAAEAKFTAITSEAAAATAAGEVPVESTTRKPAKKGNHALRHPVDVRLHHNDFNFDDYKKFVEEQEKQQQQQQQQQQPTSSSSSGAAAASAAASSTGDDAGAAAGQTASSKAAAAAASTELQGAEAQKHLAAQAAAWETHYVQTKNNFFPIKNYLTQAFKSVVLPLFPEDQRLSVEQRAAAAKDGADDEQETEMKREDEADLEEVANKSSAVVASVSNDKNNKNQDDDHDDASPAQQPPSRFIVECGCGTGSALLPLMNTIGHIHRFAGFDISKTAVALFAQHEIVATKLSQKPVLFAHDIAAADVPEVLIPPHSADIMLLIFVLNAIERSKMPAVLRRLHAIMKPGGKLLFRDHGELDNSYLRFKKNGNKTCGGSFVKGDSTQQYFFSLDECRQMFGQCRFATTELAYHCNQVTNRKTNVTMHKVIVNGIFTAN